MADNLTQLIPKWTTDFEFCELFGGIKLTTFREYWSDLTLFSQFLHDHQYPCQLPIAPEHVKKWLEACVDAGIRPNTIKRRKTAISFIHEINEFHIENPAYHPLLRGFYKKVKQVRSKKGLSNRLLQKEPLTKDLLKKLVRQCSKKTLTGLRNRALLLVGFPAALRRSELCNLQWPDVKIEDDHSEMTLIIQHSKTDTLSEGKPLTISKGIPNYCPIQALLDWQHASGLTTGYIFRNLYKLNDNKPINPQAYVKLIKKCCEKAGLDPALYSGHSTRRGMLVTASDNGSDIHILRAHARHQNSQMTEHYIGDAISKRNNPTKGLFR
ncbi:tyrosine-type recombinase/integrase [Endozoicomonas sp.]|uniref:tyrosine-type recombinase/integrase n=1 Tax=Endozoicomonas sp. TaxID=1892382 RepID=UPI0028852FE0|nr:tyrosine-type recombinase/integrase [Endozoicomonas sp.]